ncbi:hypothetical protein J1N35_011588 [Gossypium stocksii]|uniref:Uncharacterized protein n=1 Tax=Gossypium stocksii TaxID=47602 RepID=A0A9D4ADI7_9ROSI|nr:hypothetical protein J1N35_011588 [Gossypium stocksii]
MVKKKRQFDFLTRLNTKFDQIWVQVLGKISFPSPHMAYSYVQQKESHHGVMFYNPPLEKAGFITNQNGPLGGQSTKDHLTCNYCGLCSLMVVNHSSVPFVSKNRMSLSYAFDWSTLY